MKEIIIETLKIKVENDVLDRKLLEIKDLENSVYIVDFLTVDDFIQLRNFLNDVIKDF